MKIIKKAGLAVFKDKKILLGRSKNQPEVFYIIGGKYRGDETDIECLEREIKEELGCEVDAGSLKFLNHFEDVAHGDQGMLHLNLYEGNLIGYPKPSSEIAEIGYFDTTSNPENLSVIAKRTIFPWLKEHGYIG